MNTADPNKKELTTEECISSLETLFKAYQKDSEFNYQLSVSNSPFNLLKKRLTQTSKKKKIQKYFERHFGYGWEQSEKAFNKLLNDGWKIVLAIPIQYGKSCYSCYTGEVHYVLEKEVEEE